MNMSATLGRPSGPPLAAETSVLERVCGLLADRTRLRILNLLAAGELCVCDLVDVLSLPQPTVSRHLQMLRAGSLVSVRRIGRFAHYRLGGGGEATESELLDLVVRRLDGAPDFAPERRLAVQRVAARTARPCGEGT